MASQFYKGSVAEGSAEALKRDLSLVFFVAGLRTDPFFLGAILPNRYLGEEDCWLSMKWKSVYLKHPEVCCVSCARA